jgi:hypothetical protein
MFFDIIRSSLFSGFFFFLPSVVMGVPIPLGKNYFVPVLYTHLALPHLRGCFSLHQELCSVDCVWDFYCGWVASFPKV